MRVVGFGNLSRVGMSVTRDVRLSELYGGVDLRLETVASAGSRLFPFLFLIWAGNLRRVLNLARFLREV